MIHEVNAPANQLMLLDANRAIMRLEGPLALHLFEKLAENAHKAGLQLQAINAGEPLTSVQLNAQYADGWRFTGNGPRKLPPCSCGYTGFRRESNGFCDDCNLKNKVHSTGGQP